MRVMGRVSPRGSIGRVTSKQGGALQAKVGRSYGNMVGALISNNMGGCVMCGGPSLILMTFHAKLPLTVAKHANFVWIFGFLP